MSETAPSPDAATIAAAERLFAILYTPGPSWDHTVPVAQQPLRDHGRYMASLLADGRLAKAGPFLDADAGGIAFVRAGSAEDAEAIMRADPAVQRGLMAATVRPFLAMFDGERPAEG